MVINLEVPSNPESGRNWCNSILRLHSTRIQHWEPDGINRFKYVQYKHIHQPWSQHHILGFKYKHYVWNAWLTTSSHVQYVPWPTWMKNPREKKGLEDTWLKCLNFSAATYLTMPRGDRLLWASINQMSFVGWGKARRVYRGSTCRVFTSRWELLST